MHCIENELNQCITAINNQSHKTIEYFLVQDLPNKEAHDKLYSTFMNRASDFDLFIKVDADMVLCRNTFFDEVIQEFSRDPEMDELEVAVQDFFTNRLIYGLHVFRNTVTWNISNEEKFFVDCIQYSHKHIYDNSNLAPAAYHCPNPSDFQCFHFGLHKAIKVIQLDRQEKDLAMSYNHWENLALVLEQFNKNKDKRLGFALHGAKWAVKKQWTSDFINYSNPEVMTAFQKISSFSNSKFENQLKKEPLFYFWLNNRVISSFQKHQLYFFLKIKKDFRFVSLIKFSNKILTILVRRFSDFFSHFKFNLK